MLLGIRYINNNVKVSLILSRCAFIVYSLCCIINWIWHIKHLNTLVIGCENIVCKITKVETAVEPKFQEHFVAANAIPHKTDPFTELNKLVKIPNPSFNALSKKNGKMGRRRRRRS